MSLCSRGSISRQGGSDGDYALRMRGLDSRRFRHSAGMSFHEEHSETTTRESIEATAVKKQTPQRPTNECGTKAA